MPTEMKEFYEEDLSKPKRKFSLRNFFKTKVRIQTDRYLGYEVVYKHWYSVSWEPYGKISTFASVAAAEEHVRKVAGRVVKEYLI